MKIVYARFTTWVTSSVQIIEGEAWRADDPIVKKRPEFFAELPKIVRTTLPRHLRAEPPIEPPVEPPVEQATAAPGEKRTTRHTTRKSTTKTSDEGGSDGE